MAFMLARKLEMTQRYDGEVAVPVTILEVSPCVVTQVKTADRDGYVAVQIGGGTKKHPTQAARGHAAGRPVSRWLREFTVAEDAAGAWTVGATIDASAFKPGDRVQAIGVSKGKGFAGVVKRHRFHGQNATHGTKDQLRMPGSAAGMGRSRGGGVNRGHRMSGRMGGDRVTVRNLTVVAVDAANGRLELKGAVPGARGSLIELQSYGSYWGGAAV